MNHLSAMKEAGVLVEDVDCEEMTVTFSNGVTLPVQGFLDRRQRPSNDPVDGGWAEFGNDEFGYGLYKVKLITEEEYNQSRSRKEGVACSLM